MDIKKRLEHLKNLDNFLNKHRNNIGQLLSAVGWTEDGLMEGNVKQKKEEDKDDDFMQPSAGPSTVKTSNSTYQEILASIPQQTQGKKEKSWLEQLEEERNLKRRRISYKGKVHTKSKSHTEVMKEVIAQQMAAFQCSTEEESNQGPDEVQQDLLELRHSKLINPHTLWKNIHKYVDQSKLKTSSDEETTKQDIEERRRDELRRNEDIQERRRGELRRNERKHSNDRKYGNIEYKRERQKEHKHRSRSRDRSNHRREESIKRHWKDGRREHKPQGRDRESYPDRTPYTPRNVDYRKPKSPSRDDREPKRKDVSRKDDYSKYIAKDLSYNKEYSRNKTKEFSSKSRSNFNPGSQNLVKMEERRINCHKEVKKDKKTAETVSIDKDFLEQVFSEIQSAAKKKKNSKKSKKHKKHKRKHKSSSSESSE